MSDEQRSEAFRKRSDLIMRTQGDLRRLPEKWTIDIDYLIGAKGEKLSPVKVRDPNMDPERPEYVGDAQDLTLRSAEFIAGEYVESEYQEYTERMIGRVASRLAGRWAGEAIIDVVRTLREPLRTVAVACVFDDTSTSEVAHEFGTSVETIEFLYETALDALASRISLG